MSSFVIDDLGIVYHRDNWDGLRRQLSPRWLSLLGPGRSVDPASFFGIPVVRDPSVPPNSFELRSGTQRVRVINVGRRDESAEISRWEDDGGTTS